MKTTELKRRITRGGLFAAAAVAAVHVNPQPAMGGGAGGVGGQNGVGNGRVAGEGLTIYGMLRDFRMAHEAGGHPDFEVVPPNGAGTYMGCVEAYLDADGKPVFSGSAKLVGSPWTNSAGESIHPDLFDASQGDVEGSWALESADAAITSAQSFRQWFREVPGMNTSAAFLITLAQDETTGNFVFDDRLDTHFANLPGGNKNRNFTYEVEAHLTYVAGSGQQFTFSGDDDIWVFIDGRLVVDIGGVHANTAQTVELDRLDWLVDGESYSMKVFYANRVKNTARLRIETNGVIHRGALPGTVHQFD